MIGEHPPISQPLDSHYTSRGRFNSFLHRRQLGIVWALQKKKTVLCDVGSSMLLDAAWP